MNINGPTVAMAIVLPVILGGFLIYGSKQGSKALFFAIAFVLGGLVSIVLAMGISRLVVPVEALLAAVPGSIREGLTSSFLFAAFPEELARLLTTILWIAVVRHLVGREVIVTCGMIGLGFAMFENVLYSLTATTGAEIVIGRALPTLSHGATALIMGSILATAISNGRRFHIWLLALGAPLLLHGLYDFAAFLFEVTEFPELPDDPNDTDWRLLVTPLATMFLVTAVGLVELVWAGCIAYRLRRAVVVT